MCICLFLLSFPLKTLYSIHGSSISTKLFEILTERRLFFCLFHFQTPFIFFVPPLWRNSDEYFPSLWTAVLSYLPLLFCCLILLMNRPELYVPFLKTFCLAEFYFIFLFSRWYKKGWHERIKKHETIASEKIWRIFFLFRGEKKRFSFGFFIIHRDIEWCV